MNEKDRSEKLQSFWAFCPSSALFGSLTGVAPAFFMAHDKKVNFRLACQKCPFEKTILSVDHPELITREVRYSSVLEICMAEAAAGSYE